MIFGPFDYESYETCKTYFFWVNDQIPIIKRVEDLMNC
jgi:hypothetical protein